MSTDKDLISSDGKEIINPDGSVVPEIELDNGSDDVEDDFLTKDKIPSFKKILVTDDGKDSTNKVLSYAIALTNYTSSELVILHIAEDVDKLEDISVEGSNNAKDPQTRDQNFKRTIKGEIIDAMEDKIKKCTEAGCKGRISYKFLAGNAVHEIVNEINDTNNNYDLVILSTSHIDSWFRSLFSDARKIISNISKPVLIIQ
ncbi:MAG: universal stress protein [Nitrososphaeraceae archaeon]